jgi:hypothetical protein
MKIKKILSFIIIFGFFCTADLAVTKLWGFPLGIMFTFLNTPVIFLIREYVIEKKNSTNK